GRPPRRVRGRRVAPRLPPSLRGGGGAAVRHLPEGARAGSRDPRRVPSHPPRRGIPHELHARAIDAHRGPPYPPSNLAGPAGEAVEGLSARGRRPGRRDRDAALARPVLRALAALRLPRPPSGAARAARFRRIPRAPRCGEPVLMRILGISAHYHDSAAALVVDGVPRSEEHTS